MEAKVAVIDTLRLPPEKIESVLSHLKEFVEKTNQIDGYILTCTTQTPRITAKATVDKCALPLKPKPGPPSG